MNHIDLFSGIGGFALAAREVWGDEYKNVLFCDNNKFCQEVIKKNFGKDSVIYGDIREVSAEAICNYFKLKRRSTSSFVGFSGTPKKDTEVFTQTSGLSIAKDADVQNEINLLTAGVPCQPASCAGKRRGTSDDRWLWPEAFRIIRETKPTWVILENVRGLLTLEKGLVFQNLCAELEGYGYEVQPVIIPACAVNAPHRRDRVWIIAYLQESRREARDRICSERLCHQKERSKAWGENSGCDWNQNWLEVATRFCGMDARFPDWMDRYFGEVIYDSTYDPQEMQILFRAIQSPKIREAVGRLYKVDESEVLLETVCQLQKRIRESERLRLARKTASKNEVRVMPEYEQIRCSPQRREHSKQFAKKLTDIVQELSYETALAVVETGLILWGAYSSIYSQAVELDGFKLTKARHRVERLKALGNAIVPQVAVEIFKAIKQTNL